MLIPPNKIVASSQAYRIRTTAQIIEMRCCIEVAADEYDEWIIPNPAYFIGQKVWIINPDLPSENWEEKRIFGIQLYAPRWQHGSLICEPIWYCGIKALNGQGETKWLSETEITDNPQACDFESDHF